MHISPFVLHSRLCCWHWYVVISCMCTFVHHMYCVVPPNHSACYLTQDAGTHKGSVSKLWAARLSSLTAFCKSSLTIIWSKYCPYCLSIFSAVWIISSNSSFCKKKRHNTNHYSNENNQQCKTTHFLLYYIILNLKCLIYFWLSVNYIEFKCFKQHKIDLSTMALF